MLRTNENRDALLPWSWLPATGRLLSFHAACTQSRSLRRPDLEAATGTCAVFVSNIPMMG
ncbi:MAG TPA: hypothetical protein V6D16_20880 [Candidatus Obscuribacterales bacterium]